MSLLVEQRAAGVLEVLGIEAVTMAASGRYRRSNEIQPGVRYWSSSSDRESSDSLGVQFFGPGLELYERIGDTFRAARFKERNSQTAQVTFCRSVARLDGGRFDVAGLRSIRDEIDRLIGDKAAISKDNVLNFADFMRASPLAGVDLALDPRTADERPDSL